MFSGVKGRVNLVIGLRSVNGCYPLGGRRSISGINITENHDKGYFIYSEVPNKSYIKIVGPDAPKFLNGLLTSKLLPSYLKKNLTTIDVPDGSKVDEKVESVKFDEHRQNWGLYNDIGYHGQYLSRMGQYTAILNSKSKIVTDLIIYPTPVFIEKSLPKYSKFDKHPAYLIEADTSTVSKILQIFNTHELQSKIKYKQLNGENLKTWEIMIKLPKVPNDYLNPWIENLHFPLSASKTPEASTKAIKDIITTLFNFELGEKNLEFFYKNVKGIYLDKRFDLLLEQESSSPQIIKFVTSSEIDDISQFFNKDIFPFEFVQKEVNNKYFKEFKILNGVIDSTNDYKPETIWPLELNFDYFPNTVSLDKGCYLGQEIMHRLFSTGRLKKRLVPVKLSQYEYLEQCTNDNYKDIVCTSTDSSNQQENTQEVYNPFKSQTKSTQPSIRKIMAGKLVYSDKENGLALINTDYFPKIFNTNSNDYDFTITLDSETPDQPSKIVKVIPQKPFWLPSWLKYQKGTE